MQAEAEVRKLRAFFLRLFAIFGSRDADRQLEAELESHLAMHIEDGVGSGLSEAEARRQAHIRLGGVEQVTIRYRERRGLPLMESLIQDIFYGLRMLGKNPGFALITILTLALGIGANTALFSIVNGVLLRPLPYPRPSELMAVHASKQNFDEGSISYPNFRDWQRENRTLAGLAITRSAGFTLAGNGEAERIRGQYVTSDFFSILGVKPAIGRLFSKGEDEIGAAPVAVISAGFWARKFASNPDAIGKTLTLDGRDFTIVGILPGSFDFALNNFRPRDVYVPLGQWANAAALRVRGAGLGLHGIARLKPGVTFAQAQADLIAVSDRLAAAYPEDDHGIRAKIVPMRDEMVGNVKAILWLLLGAVGFVLLIACLNVANLLHARSHARAREFAVRMALGAPRSRMVRQVLTENTLLALAGGGLGLLLAHWGTGAALKLLPATLPRASEVHLSAPVLGFTLALSITVGVLFGLLPALKISSGRVQETLREGERGSGGGRQRTQNLLVVFEMALALVLLAGAGLMVRSLMALAQVDPGFEPHGVLTFGLAAPSSLAKAPPDSATAYVREVDRRIKEVPGVEAVSLSGGALPVISEDDLGFWLEGEVKPASSNGMHGAIEYTVEPDYLRAMRIPLLRGRFFADSDDEHAPRVAVIDEALAKQYFADADPIGKQINLDGYDQKVTVIGVVGHVLQWGLDQETSNPLHAGIYFPFAQSVAMMPLRTSLATEVVVRYSGNTGGSLSAIQRALRQMNDKQAVWGADTMDHILSDSLAARRFTMVLLASFAGLALLLATIGLYGVVSYLVGQRTREIGIRMALGADRSEILRWILQQGSRLAALGAGVGLIAALGLTRIMEHWSILYGVHSYDPLTLVAVTVLLVLIALVACYLPAARAMRVDPVGALRAE